MDDYPSDNDEIHEEQVQYTYLDGEIMPVEGIEYEDQNYGIIEVVEYERVMDQATDLDNRNWELRYKCQDYEKELRILKRSVPQKIKDRIRHWKKVTANLTRRTKMWVKRLGKKSTEEDVIYRARPRYKDMLAARYYPHNLNLE